MELPPATLRRPNACNTRTQNARPFDARGFELLLLAVEACGRIGDAGQQLLHIVASVASGQKGRGAGSERCRLGKAEEEPVRGGASDPFAQDPHVDAPCE